MKTTKIAIDIGHTSTRDQGAASRDGLTEHAYWSKFAPVIQQTLEKLGHQVRLFRREDHSGSVAKECNAVNDWLADVAVSLHLNSADNKTAGGHEIIYLNNSSRGRLLAEDIDRRLDGLSGLRDRNTRTPFQGRGETWLSHTQCPAVIVEAGFLSNDQDTELLKEQGHRISELIALGIHDFFTR